MREKLNLLRLFFLTFRFIYSGKVDLTNLKGPEMLKLLIAVDELNIQTLVTCVQKYLINYKDFLQENFMEILQMVYHNELFTDLLSYCLEKIEILYESDKIISLEAPLLEFLLKRDDLNLDEVEIWNGLIKWGFAQEQGLNQDTSKWNKDDTKTFKRIIDQFIPLIKFCNISSENYFEKVKPYEEILSKELREEIIKFHLVPGYKPTFDLSSPRRFIDSTIINQKHIALFANWIELKSKNAKINFYKFNLLYRSNRDGNTAASFHSKCDNKGATIAVIKIKNSEQIVGGYNPLFWDSSNSLKNTKDSFIFSFADKSNLQNANVVYSKTGDKSIQCYRQLGPVFGVDLYTNYEPTADTWRSSVYSYPTLNLPNTFIVDNYEVFQVIKK
jgi:hypothetical protein